MAALRLPIVELAGSPRAMGEAFGAGWRGAIRRLYDQRVADAQAFVARHGAGAFEMADALGVAERSLPIAREYDPVGFEEFEGIAAGSGLSPAELFFMQGLTDIRDILAHGSGEDGDGCSALIVPAARSATGNLLLAQNWDLATSNMEYVCLVHRRPREGPETWSLTLAGCLSLIGVNGEGIAVGNTNLRTHDGDVGAQYLHLIHRALRSVSFSEAVSSIGDAPRLSGHYYYVGGPGGEAVGIECSAKRAVMCEPDGRGLVRCNHPNTAEVAEHAAPHEGDSTCFRQARLEQLMSEHEGLIDVEAIKTMLSDHEGGDEAICRHNVPPAGISTNACVILSPQTREIHACRGQPHVGVWEHRACGDDAGV